MTAANGGAFDARYLSAVARVRAAVPERAFVLDVAAAATVEHLVSWACDRDADVLAAWTARTWERYGNVDALATLLRDAAPRTFANAAWRGELALAEHDVAAIAERMGAAIDEVRRSPPPPANLDETDAVIDEFIVTLDGIDPLTAEHSRAVASWCARISRELGLDQADTQHARRAGLLHDVGKIRVPFEILTAPRMLTSEEWIVMRSHSEAGSELISGVSMLDEFRIPIRNHHERIDGRGYPDGIPSTELPLSTRIVAVADGFNAMIAQRPYRRPMRPVDALDELNRVAGAQFDGEVVAALIRVIGRTTDRRLVGRALG